MVSTRNSFDGIYLKEITLDDYKCFKGENSFSFVTPSASYFKLHQWTVFLGNNGTGKTNLLKAIANMEPRKADYTNKEIGIDKENSCQDSPKVEDMFLDMMVAVGDKPISKDLSKEEQFQPKVIERFKKGDYSVSCSFIKSTDVARLGDKRGTTLNRQVTYCDNKIFSSPAQLSYGPTHNFTDPTKELENLQIYAYGVNRVADKTGLNSELKDSAASLFADNAPLLNFEDWLLQLELAKGKKPGASDRLKLLKRIFSKSSIFPHILNFNLVTDDNYNNHIEFECEDGSFRFEELGYGYQCMLAWIFDFCKRMFDRYPNSKNPLKEAAVVLIDEIDLHLHPQWQRHILKDLSTLFPNTQFIVSTHSPLVIQSIEDINLYVLLKEEDHTKVIKCDEKTFQGWSIDEILDELMQLGSNVRSLRYQELMKIFDKALDDDDYSKAKEAYTELKNILHPLNAENKILKMQLDQIKPQDND